MKIFAVSGLIAGIVLAGHGIFLTVSVIRLSKLYSEFEAKMPNSSYIIPFLVIVFGLVLLFFSIRILRKKV